MAQRIDADVNILLGRFCDLTCDGRLILHEEVESLLQMTRKQSRYKTVTKRWRKILMDEQRVFLDGRSALGHGFRSLTPDEAIRAIGRQVKKAIRVNGLPDLPELSSSESRRFQVQLMLACEQIRLSHRVSGL